METRERERRQLHIKNRLFFRERTKIIKYGLGNLEEGNELAIKSISLMKKSSSAIHFTEEKRNTRSIKTNQQQDSLACRQQKQLPQNNLYPTAFNACYSLPV